MIADAREIVSTAKMYKNVVLEGPPGTGKTLLISEIAANWEVVTGRKLGGHGRDDWAMAFHGNTGYEDFVEGIRPVDDNFRVLKGFLRERVDKAKNHPNEDFLVLLDEFNRANVAKVLGDALLLLESSKRLEHRAGDWTGGMTVTLPYSHDTFGIPDNLYFIATMNTSDSSIARMDSALRRRFAFIRIQPLAAAELREALVGQYGELAAARLDNSSSHWTKLNTQVLQPIFGADSMIGHSHIFALADQLQLNQISPPGVGSPDTYAALLKAAIDSGANVTSSFWLETGALTGGSRNQIDLSKSGRLNPDHGSIHYFLPTLSGVALSPTNEATFDVDVDFEGKTYRGCEIKYYSGADSNQSWRINLNGIADDGTKLSASGAKGAFANGVLLFFEVALNHYALYVMQKSSIPMLELRSASDAISSGRKYGKILESRIAGTEAGSNTESRTDYERILWRHGILPQLLETISAQTADALLVPSLRVDFVHGFTDLSMEVREKAVHALSDLDIFLDSMGLAIQADGVGLSRTLTVSAGPRNRALSAFESELASRNVYEAGQSTDSGSTNSTPGS